MTVKRKKGALYIIAMLLLSVLIFSGAAIGSVAAENSVARTVSASGSVEVKKEQAIKFIDGVSASLIELINDHSDKVVVFGFDAKMTEVINKAKAGADIEGAADADSLREEVNDFLTDVWSGENGVAYAPSGIAFYMWADNADMGKVLTGWQMVMAASLCLKAGGDLNGSPIAGLLSDTKLAGKTADETIAFFNPNPETAIYDFSQQVEILEKYIKAQDGALIAAFDYILESLTASAKTELLTLLNNVSGLERAVKTQAVWKQTDDAVAATEGYESETDVSVIRGYLQAIYAGLAAAKSESIKAIEDEEKIYRDRIKDFVADALAKYDGETNGQPALWNIAKTNAEAATDLSWAGILAAYAAFDENGGLTSGELKALRGIIGAVQDVWVFGNNLLAAAYGGLGGYAQTGDFDKRTESWDSSMISEFTAAVEADVTAGLKENLLRLWERFLQDIEDTADTDGLVSDIKSAANTAHTDALKAADKIAVKFEAIIAAQKAFSEKYTDAGAEFKAGYYYKLHSAIAGYYDEEIATIYGGFPTKDYLAWYENMTVSTKVIKGKADSLIGYIKFFADGMPQLFESALGKIKEYADTEFNRISATEKLDGKCVDFEGFFYFTLDSQVLELTGTDNLFKALLAGNAQSAGEELTALLNQFGSLYSKGLFADAEAFVNNLAAEYNGRIDDLTAALAALINHYNGMFDLLSGFDKPYESKLIKDENGSKTYESILNLLAAPSGFMLFSSGSGALENYLISHFNSLMYSQDIIESVNSLIAAAEAGINQSIVDAATDLFMSEFYHYVAQLIEEMRLVYGEYAITVFENNFAGFSAIGGEYYNFLRGELNPDNLSDFLASGRVVSVSDFFGDRAKESAEGTIAAIMSDTSSQEYAGLLAARKSVILTKLDEVYEEYNGTVYYQSWFANFISTYRNFVRLTDSFDDLDEAEKEIIGEYNRISAAIIEIEKIKTKAVGELIKLQELLRLSGGDAEFIGTLDRYVTNINNTDKLADIELFKDDYKRDIAYYLTFNGQSMLDYLVNLINGLPEENEIRYIHREDIFAAKTIEENLRDNGFVLETYDKSAFDKLYGNGQGKRSLIYLAENIYQFEILFNDDFYEIIPSVPYLGAANGNSSLANGGTYDFLLEDGVLEFSVTVRAGFRLNKIEIDHAGSGGRTLFYGQDFAVGTISGAQQAFFSANITDIAANKGFIDVLNAEAAEFKFTVLTVIDNAAAYATQEITFIYKGSAGGAYFYDYINKYDYNGKTLIGGKEVEFDGFRLATFGGRRIDGTFLFTDDIVIVARFISVNPVRVADIITEEVVNKVVGVKTIKANGSLTVGYNDTLDEDTAGLVTFIKRPSSAATRANTAKSFAGSSGLGSVNIAGSSLGFECTSDMVLGGEYKKTDYRLYWYDDAGNLVAVSTLIVVIEEYETVSVTFSDKFRTGFGAGGKIGIEILKGSTLDLSRFFVDKNLNIHFGTKLTVSQDIGDIKAGEYVFGAWVRWDNGPVDYLVYEGSGLTAIDNDVNYEARWFKLETLTGSDAGFFSEYSGGHIGTLYKNIVWTDENHAEITEATSSSDKIQGLVIGRDGLYDTAALDASNAQLGGDALYYGMRISAPAGYNVFAGEYVAAKGNGFTKITGAAFGGGFLYAAIPFAAKEIGSWDNNLYNPADYKNLIVVIGGEEYYRFDYTAVFMNTDMYGTAYQFSVFFKVYYEYEVAFDLNDSDKINGVNYPAAWSESPYVTVAYGNNAAQPAQNPVRTHYTFAGWYLDAEGKIPCVFANLIIKKAGIKIYAKWTLEEYTVVYSYDDGGTSKTFASLKVKFGDTVEMPEFDVGGFAFYEWRFVKTGAPLIAGSIADDTVSDGLFIYISASTLELKPLNNGEFRDSAILSSVSYYDYGKYLVSPPTAPVAGNTDGDYDKWKYILNNYASMLANYKNTSIIFDYNDVVDFDAYAEFVDTYSITYLGGDFFKWAPDDVDKDNTLYLRVFFKTDYDWYSLTPGGCRLQAFYGNTVIYVPFAEKSNGKWVAVGDGYRSTKDVLAGGYYEIYWFDAQEGGAVCDAYRGDIRFMDYQEVAVTLIHEYKNTEIRPITTEVSMIWGKSAADLKNKMNTAEIKYNGETRTISNWIERGGYKIERWVEYYNRNSAYTLDETNRLTRAITLVAEIKAAEFGVVLKSVGGFGITFGEYDITPAKALGEDGETVYAIPALSRAYDDFLNAPAPVLTGHCFIGWTAEHPDSWLEMPSSFVYKIGTPDTDNRLTFIPQSSDDTLTLYAYFAQDKYTVAVIDGYHNEYHTAPQDQWDNNVKEYSGIVFGTKLLYNGISLDNYSVNARDGYLFGGWWYGAADGVGGYVIDEENPVRFSQNDLIISENTVIVAKWVPISMPVAWTSQNSGIDITTDAGTSTVKIGFKGFIEEKENTLNETKEIFGPAEYSSGEIYVTVNLTTQENALYVVGSSLDVWADLGPSVWAEAAAKGQNTGGQGIVSFKVRVGTYTDIADKLTYTFGAYSQSGLKLVLGDANGNILSAYSVNLEVDNYLEFLKGLPDSYTGYVWRQLSDWDLRARSYTVDLWLEVYGVKTSYENGTFAAGGRAGATYKDLIDVYNRLVAVLNNSAVIQALEFFEKEFAKFNKYNYRFAVYNTNIAAKKETYINEIRISANPMDAAQKRIETINLINDVWDELESDKAQAIAAISEFNSGEYAVSQVGEYAGFGLRLAEYINAINSVRLASWVAGSWPAGTWFDGKGPWLNGSGAWTDGKGPARTNASSYANHTAAESELAAAKAQTAALLQRAKDFITVYRYMRPVINELDSELFRVGFEIKDEVSIYVDALGSIISRAEEMNFANPLFANPAEYSVSSTYNISIYFNDYFRSVLSQAKIALASYGEKIVFNFLTAVNKLNGIDTQNLTTDDRKAIIEAMAAEKLLMNGHKEKNEVKNAIAKLAPFKDLLGVDYAKLEGKIDECLKFVEEKGTVNVSNIEAYIKFYNGLVDFYDGLADDNARVVYDAWLAEYKTQYGLRSMTDMSEHLIRAIDFAVLTGFMSVEKGENYKNENHDDYLKMPASVEIETLANTYGESGIIEVNPFRSNGSGDASISTFSSNELAWISEYLSKDWKDLTPDDQALFDYFFGTWMTLPANQAAYDEFFSEAQKIKLEDMAARVTKIFVIDISGYTGTDVDFDGLLAAIAAEGAQILTPGIENGKIRVYFDSANNLSVSFMLKIKTTARTAFTEVSINGGVNAVAAADYETGYGSNVRTLYLSWEFINGGRNIVTIRTAALVWQVTFEANRDDITAGTMPAADVVSDGEAYAKPAIIPQSTSMDFNGWFVDEACKTPYNFNNPVRGDLILYAGWKNKEYSVVVDFGDGENVFTIAGIKYGGKLGGSFINPILSIPARPGYEKQDVWYLCDESGAFIDKTITGGITIETFDWDNTQITSNLYIKIHWVQIRTLAKSDLQYDASAYFEITESSKAGVSADITFTKSINGVSDSDLGANRDGNTLKTDIAFETIFPKYAYESLISGGTQGYSVAIQLAERADADSVWYGLNERNLKYTVRVYDAAGKLWDVMTFTIYVEKYADYKITYVMNNADVEAIYSGYVMISDYVLLGGSAEGMLGYLQDENFDNSVNAGWTFAGWSTTQITPGEDYDGLLYTPAAISENLTLYAAWEKINVAVEFYYGLELKGRIETDWGEKIDTNDVPVFATPEGQYFIGWLKDLSDDGSKFDFDTDTVENSDGYILKLYARFVPYSYVSRGDYSQYFTTYNNDSEKILAGEIGFADAGYTTKITNNGIELDIPVVAVDYKNIVNWNSLKTNQETIYTQIYGGSFGADALGGFEQLGADEANVGFDAADKKLSVQMTIAEFKGGKWVPAGNGNRADENEFLAIYKFYTYVAGQITGVYYLAVAVMDYQEVNAFFEFTGGEFNNFTIPAIYGQTINLAENGTALAAGYPFKKDGYNPVKWVYKHDTSREFNFQTTAFTAEFTELVAIYTQLEYTVKFMHKGSVVASQTVKYSEKAADPGYTGYDALTGHSTVYWTMVNPSEWGTATQPVPPARFNFNTAITGELDAATEAERDGGILLYLYFLPDTITVEFWDNFGNRYTSWTKTGVYGTSLTDPSSFVKGDIINGKVFSGWYTQAQDGNSFDFAGDTIADLIINGKAARLYARFLEFEDISLSRFRVSGAITGELDIGNTGLSVVNAGSRNGLVYLKYSFAGYPGGSFTATELESLVNYLLSIKVFDGADRCVAYYKGEILDITLTGDVITVSINMTENFGGAFIPVYNVDGVYGFEMTVVWFNGDLPVAAEKLEIRIDTYYTSLSAFINQLVTDSAPSVEKTDYYYANLLPEVMHFEQYLGTAADLFYEWLKVATKQHLTDIINGILEKNDYRNETKEYIKAILRVALDDIDKNAVSDAVSICETALAKISELGKDEQNQLIESLRDLVASFGSGYNKADFIGIIGDSHNGITGAAEKEIKGLYAWGDMLAAYNKYQEQIFTIKAKIDAINNIGAALSAVYDKENRAGLYLDLPEVLGYTGKINGFASRSQIEAYTAAAIKAINAADTLFRAMDKALGNIAAALSEAYDYAGRKDSYESLAETAGYKDKIKTFNTAAQVDDYTLAAIKAINSASALFKARDKALGDIGAALSAAYDYAGRDVLYRTLPEVASYTSKINGFALSQIDAYVTDAIKAIYAADTLFRAMDKALGDIGAALSEAYDYAGRKALYESMPETIGYTEKIKAFDAVLLIDDYAAAAVKVIDAASKEFKLRDDLAGVMAKLNEFLAAFMLGPDPQPEAKPVYDEADFADILAKYTAIINGSAEKSLAEEFLQLAKEEIKQRAQEIDAAKERLAEEATKALKAAKEAAINGTSENAGIKDTVAGFAEDGYSIHDFEALINDYSDRINAAASLKTVEYILNEALDAIDALARRIETNKNKVAGKLQFDEVLGEVRSVLGDIIDRPEQKITSRGVITSYLTQDVKADIEAQILAEIRKSDISTDGIDRAMAAVRKYIASLENLDYTLSLAVFASELDKAKTALNTELNVIRKQEAELDNTKAAQVTQLIAALNGNSGKEDVAAVRKAYDGLTQRQKSLVFNVANLEIAENSGGSSENFMWIIVVLLLILFILAVVILINISRKGKGGGDFRGNGPITETAGNSNADVFDSSTAAPNNAGDKAAALNKYDASEAAPFSKYDAAKPIFNYEGSESVTFNYEDFEQAVNNAENTEFAVNYTSYKSVMYNTVETVVRDPETVEPEAFNNNLTPASPQVMGFSIWDRLAAEEELRVGDLGEYAGEDEEGYFDEEDFEEEYADEAEFEDEYADEAESEDEYFDEDELEEEYADEVESEEEYADEAETEKEYAEEAKPEQKKFVPPIRGFSILERLAAEEEFQRSDKYDLGEYESEDEEGEDFEEEYADEVESEEEYADEAETEKEYAEEAKPEQKKFVPQVKGFSILDRLAAEEEFQRSDKYDLGEYESEDEEGEDFEEEYADEVESEEEYADEVESEEEYAEEAETEEEYVEEVKPEQKKFVPPKIGFSILERLAAEDEFNKGDIGEYTGDDDESDDEIEFEEDAEFDEIEKHIAKIRQEKKSSAPTVKGFSILERLAAEESFKEAELGEYSGEDEDDELEEEDDGDEIKVKAKKRNTPNKRKPFVPPKIGFSILERLAAEEKSGETEFGEYSGEDEDDYSDNADFDDDDDDDFDGEGDFEYSGEAGEASEPVVAEESRLKAFEMPAVIAAAKSYRKPMAERLLGTLTSNKYLYSILKNELLSYRNVNARMTRQLEKFTVGRKIIARISLVGKTLRLYLALIPGMYEPKVYHHKDVSNIRKYAETPFFLKIKSERTLGKALSLIADLMIDKEQMKRRKFEETDYVMTYRNKELTPLGSIGLKYLITDKITAAQTETLSDYNANKCTLVEKAPTNPDPLKYMIEIGVISENFKSGETVDLRQLLRKKLVPQGTEYIKIGAEGSLDKVLTVVANSFAIPALKMIVLLGGLAVRIKEDGEQDA